MTTLRLVLGDQLSPDLSALSDLDAARDVVLLAEVEAEATYAPHHRKKIAFVFAAMRHFAAELRERGVTVDYVTLDDPHNSHSLGGEVARAAKRHKARRVVLTEPGEWRLWHEFGRWHEELGLQVEMRADTRFLCGRAEFADWADGRKTLRMEHFYRRMRKRSGLLMRDDGKPEGGRWNFDAENRKRLAEDVELPDRPRFAPDATTRAVLALVGERFGDAFGELEPFDLAVTRSDAEAAFDAFVADALPRFGDYQDAMKAGEPYLFHAAVSTYLNAGLLDAGALCRRAEAEYRAGRAPLNAVEGFVRQILGWREFVRGVYWLQMPEYSRRNALSATRPLPDFYWTGETRMRCIAETVRDIRRNAYAHHIQRLMVTGNFALLAGLDPDEVCDWYLGVFSDAYEWVELPNTRGMALFADGGVLASKPYAASGAYIDRMSDYCRDCAYDVKAKTGKTACPFNYLYWNFLIENRPALDRNPRLAMPYRVLDSMSARQRETIAADARRFLCSTEMRGDAVAASGTG